MCTLVSQKKNHDLYEFLPVRILLITGKDAYYSRTHIPNSPFSLYIMLCTKTGTARYFGPRHDI